MKKVFQSIYLYLQSIGKALMMPIAVLPAAALLTGIARWIDPAVMDAGVHNQVAQILFSSGTALLDNMAILFAVGLAYGLSKDKNGAAALTALVMWLVMTKLTDPAISVPNYAFLNVEGESLDAFGKIDNQFIGILVGCLSAGVYNHTKDVELPKALSFFSGRRLSLIAASIVGVLLSMVLLFVWPVAFNGLVKFGESLLSLGAIGAGLYGFLNRLLIPLGLHHALNSVFWFDVAGINDIANYQKGIETVAGLPNYKAGMYQAGFFPVMMFGVPAAACAIWHNARDKQKKRIAGIMIAGAFAAFFTGVTEPIEFSFMFVAFPLYFVHAVLTGISLGLAAAMDWMAGFGFSAGLVDFILGYSSKAQHNALMLMAFGLLYFVIYFVIFNFAIKKFNLMTPGRDEVEDNLEEVSGDGAGVNKHTAKAQALLDIIGKDNLVNVDNCSTRLRLDVKDSTVIDADAIKKVAAGAVKPTDKTIQIIVGPEVEFVAEQLKSLK